ncbi:hypothetical protein, partial [Subdoligranulum variabile]|uniref:hypothetical protein n=1 Tax=Subdoligranulum variabile TaxID=214851 RepID=UPI0026EC6F41
PSSSSTFPTTLTIPTIFSTNNSNPPACKESLQVGGFFDYGYFLPRINFTTCFSIQAYVQVYGVLAPFLGGKIVALPKKKAP